MLKNTADIFSQVYPHLTAEESDSGAVDDEKGMTFMPRLDELEEGDTMGWDAETNETFPVYEKPPTDSQDKIAIVTILKQSHEDHAITKYDDPNPDDEWERERWPGYSKEAKENPDKYSHGYEGVKLIRWVKYGKPNRWGHDYWAETEYCKFGYRATYGYSSVTGEASCYCD